MPQVGPIRKVGRRWAVKAEKEEEVSTDSG